jgi:hypothetical protein
MGRRQLWCRNAHKKGTLFAVSTMIRGCSSFVRSSDAILLREISQMAILQLWASAIPNQAGRREQLKGRPEVRLLLNRHVSVGLYIDISG